MCDYLSLSVIYAVEPPPPRFNWGQGEDLETRLIETPGPIMVRIEHKTNSHMHLMSLV